MRPLDKFQLKFTDSSNWNNKQLSRQSKPDSMTNQCLPRFQFTHFVKSMRFIPTWCCTVYFHNETQTKIVNFYENSERNDRIL